MKTIQISFKAMFLFYIGLLLSGCSNNELDIDNTGETKSILLVISNNQAIQSYSTGSSQSGAPVVLNSAVLYLTNAEGIIMKYYTLTSAQSNYTTGGNNISLTDAQNGTAALTSLPASITNATIVGNTTGLPTSGNISAVKATVLNVESQKTISSVNLYATGDLVSVSGSQYKVDLKLSPIVARIEIPDIKANGIISGFTVDGIFVDRFYSKSTVDGTLAGANLSALSTNSADFAANATTGTTKYPLATKDAVYDIPGIVATSKLAKPATAGQVWAYNLFSSATGSQIPTIVIRLTNITTSDPNVTYSNPQYLTIKGFKNAGTAVTALKAGEVYAITAGSLVFSETNISPNPNQAAIDVNVKVSLASWAVVSVTPDI